MKKGEQSPPDGKGEPQPLLTKEVALREQNFMSNQRKDSKAKVVAAAEAHEGPPDDSMGTFFTRSAGGGSRILFFSLPFPPPHNACSPLYLVCMAVHDCYY